MSDPEASFIGSSYDFAVAIASTAALWAVGDVVAQTAENRCKIPFDWPRTLRQVSFGGLVLAPLATCWYGSLGYLFPGESFGWTCLKVLLDQTLWAPFILTLMYVVLALMQGRTLQDGIEDVKERIHATMKANWMLWPFVQLFNFALIPTRFQLLIVNIVSIPWTAFLSLKANRDAASEKTTETRRLWGEAGHQFTSLHDETELA